MGERLAVPVPAGAPVGEHLLERATDGLGPLMRRGERAAEVVARGSPDLITPGARVDVVVTRERRDSQLALENVEVLSARPVTEEEPGRRSPRRCGSRSGRRCISRRQRRSPPRSGCSPARPVTTAVPARRWSAAT